MKKKNDKSSELRGLEAWLPFKRELNELEELFESDSFFSVPRYNSDTGTLISYTPPHPNVIYPPKIKVTNG